MSKKFSSLLERRKFLKKSLGTVLVAPPLLSLGWLPKSLASSESGSETAPGLSPQPASGALTADVVVIGAGFAGISAARQLTQAGKRVIVLEARDRIGGRTCTETVAGGLRLDVGGQWIGPTQHRMNRLARELGAETFKTYDTGKNVLEDDGKVSSYTGTIPTLDVLSLLDLDRGIKELDKLAAKISLDQPWASPNAHELDSQTLETWLKNNLWLQPSRRMLAGGLRQIFAAEPNRISLLHALFYIRSAGSVNTLLAVTGGAQQDRFKNGTADLIHRMAAPFLDSIRLNSPVQAISQNESSLTVTGPGYSVTAGRAIVAIPPTLASRIDYSPLLSADRDQLTQSMPMGACLKVMAFYPKPFWRAQGLSGQAVSTDGAIFSTFDNSPANGSAGVMVGFAVGNDAERLRRLSLPQRKQAVLSAFGKLFGPEATSPTDYLEHDWSGEKWSRGCFVGYFPPGVWTALGHALRRPEGRIHWAGTETAREWNGYIEGAVESGERAAKEIFRAGV